MGLIIRKATLKDISDIQYLNYELCKKEAREYDSSINVRFPLGKEGKAYFKNRIIGKKSIAFVAVFDDNVVGYIIGTICKPEIYRKKCCIAEAENMFVKEEYRGKRIGTLLMKEFSNWCKIKNAKKVRVVISTRNKQSVEFHKKNNFRDYNVLLEKSVEK